MRAPRRLGAALVLAVLALAGPARGETIAAQDVDRILSVARSFGAAERTVGSDGAPLLRAEMEGAAYLIVFYGCAADGSGCGDLQFAALWDAGADPDPTGPDLRRINAWNRDHMVGAAYIDANGAVGLKMETAIGAGADRGAVEATFERWRAALASFKAFYFQ